MFMYLKDLNKLQSNKVKMKYFQKYFQPEFINNIQKTKTSVFQLPTI
jgi:hypothetical protein